MSQATIDSKQQEITGRVQVAYLMPVEVIVDLDEGRVAQVVDIDEGLRLDESVGVRTETLEEAVSDAVKQRAIEIAESSEWPPHESGF